MTRTEAARKAAYARAAALTPERRSEIARMGALAKNKRHPIELMSRKGGLAMVERLGRIGLAEKCAKWRRKNPSALVRIVIGWLDELGLAQGRDYELDREVDQWFGDIVLKGKKRIIEVNGKAWHRENWHGELAERAERDQAKLEAWVNGRRRVLVLDESEIRNGSGKARLRAFVNQIIERKKGSDERA